MSYSRESIKIKDNELRCLIRSDGSYTKDGPDIISIRGLKADRHFALARNKLRRDDITGIHELFFLIGAEVRFCVIGNLLAFNQDIERALSPSVAAERHPQCDRPRILNRHVE